MLEINSQEQPVYHWGACSGVWGAWYDKYRKSGAQNGMDTNLTLDALQTPNIEGIFLEIAKQINITFCGMLA